MERIIACLEPDIDIDAGPLDVFRITHPLCPLVFVQTVSSVFGVKEVSTETLP